MSAYLVSIFHDPITATNTPLHCRFQTASTAGFGTGSREAAVEGAGVPLPDYGTGSGNHLMNKKKVGPRCRPTLPGSLWSRSRRKTSKNYIIHPFHPESKSSSKMNIHPRSVSKIHTTNHIHFIHTIHYIIHTRGKGIRI